MKHSFFIRILALCLCALLIPVSSALASEARRPVYNGVSYSTQSLTQVWLAGQSWQVRLYSRVGSTDGMSEQGTQRTFREALSKDQNGKILLTLTVHHSSEEGFPMVCLSLHALRRLVRLEITALKVESGELSETYPLADLLTVMREEGLDSFEEIWLIGMDELVVVVDQAGKKQLV